MLEEQESNTKKVSEPEEGHSEEEHEDRTNMVEEEKVAPVDEDDEPERTDSEPEDRKKAKSIDVWECKNDF